MAAAAYASLVAPQHTGTGVADFFLWAPVADFAANGIKMPTPGVTPALGDAVDISANHTFLATKGFIRVLNSPEFNEITASSVGEKGSKKLEVKAKLFIPGSYNALHDTIKMMKNTPGIVLLKDADCGAGYWYQIGTDCLFAWASPEFATSTVKDGRKGYTLEFSCYQDSILRYSGTITEI